MYSYIVDTNWIHLQKTQLSVFYIKMELAEFLLLWETKKAKKAILTLKTHKLFF